MDLLTVKQVAQRLNISPSFVYELLKSGRLKHYRLGKGQGGLRISEKQLAAYLEGAEGTTPSAPGEKQNPAPRSGMFKHLDAEKLAEAWKHE